MGIREIREGRIYWAKPRATAGFPNSKQRPVLCLKNQKNLILCIQIGSQNPHENSSLNATKIAQDILDLLPNGPNKSFFWLDPSKYEWKNSIISPYISTGEKKFLDLEYEKRKKIEHLYFKRIDDLEIIRINRAKGFVLQKKYKKAARELNLLKQIKYKKYSSINPEKQIEKWKISLKSSSSLLD